MSTPLDTEEHKRDIGKKQSEIKGQQNTPASSFQRFEDLAQKLVNVPKEEIDHAEKNYERRKKRHEANKTAK